MKLKTILWYLGVVVTALVLLFAVLRGSWILSVCTLVLALILRATNKHIPLPKVYQQLGMKNDMFEGK